MPYTLPDRLALRITTALIGFALVAILAMARDPAVGASPAAGPESDNASPDTAATRQINERYAEVYLKIAEINLQKAIESDRRVPNTIPLVELDRLKQIVHLAQAQYKAAKAGEKQDLTLENDTSQVKVAQEALQKAVAANNRTPGSIPQIELDRLRLLAELSRLQLAKDKSADESKVTTTALQRRVDHLEEQVRELQKQVARLAPTPHAKSTDSSDNGTR